MADAIAPVVAAAAEEAEDGKYEAVVYFHGIGEQRRYAELGRLIDAMDIYGQKGRPPDGNPGMLRGITGRFDPAQGSGDTSEIGFADVRYVAPPGEEPSRRTFRFYEAYWAPQTAKGVPSLDALWWLVRNMFRPLLILFSRWRSHGRIRATFLHDLRDRLGEPVWAALLAVNWAFEGLEARRLYPKGRFRDFRTFLKAGAPDRPELVRAAERWWRSMRSRAVLYQVTLVTIVVGCALGFLAVAMVILWLLARVASVPWAVTLLGDTADATLANATALAGTLLLQIGLGSFLTKTFGDVVFWASYRETDQRFETRARMLRVGVATLKQVLEDPLCSRIVVVAHSLGTTIAYEALLEIGKFNVARRRDAPQKGPLPVERLDQFITLGSPVDKLHYFIESHAGGGHRYVRLYETLHGDLSTVPFAQNRHPAIHWINLWSRADIISGALSSPMSMQHPGIRPIDNVEIWSTLFPDPGLSHSGYFCNLTAARIMFEAIFRRSYSYRTPVTVTEVHNGRQVEVPDFDATDVRETERDLLARPLQAAVGILIWLIAVYWLGRIFAWQSPALAIIGWTALVLGLGLALFALVGRVRGVRNLVRPLAGREREDDDG